MFCPQGCMPGAMRSRQQQNRRRHHREEDEDDVPDRRHRNNGAVDPNDIHVEVHGVTIGKGNGAHHDEEEGAVKRQNSGDSGLLNRKKSTHSSTSDASARVHTVEMPVQRGEEHMAEHQRKKHGDEDAIITLQKEHRYTIGFFCVASFGILIILCVWSACGLLPEEHIGHVHRTKTRTGHIHSPIYVTPANIELIGTEKDVFDVRIVGMSMTDFSHAHHRRMTETNRQWWQKKVRNQRYPAKAVKEPSRRLSELETGHETSGHGAKGSSGTEQHTGTTEHGTTGHTEHGSTEHGSTEHGATTEHGSTTEHAGSGEGHGSTEHSTTEHGATEHGTSEHGTSEHGTTGHGATEHGTTANGTATHGESGHGEASTGHGDGGHHGGTGTLTYALLADGVEFFRETIELSDEMETEFFNTVQVKEAGANFGRHYTTQVTAHTSHGDHVAFMMQVVRMNEGANYRFWIGMGLFVLTFGFIVSEVIHRCYSAAIGASFVLCVLAAIQETPELHDITGMIEWGTLMLLFSMMILMQMLAMTGFFKWFSLKVIILSKQDPRKLFYLLTLCCGFMSMVLDNVTCVLLTGPLTYQIAKKMQLNPRPYYLSMTICATIGGTATLIGDPPNIVIGMKLKLGFETFLMVNFPIVTFVLLPVAAFILYNKFKGELCKYTDKPPTLDFTELEKENCIRNEPMFYELGCVLLAVLFGFLTSPWHHIEPAWFTVFAMFGCAVRFDHEEIRKWLELVELDTLFFFALLFVLVEALSELGVIRALGNAIIQLICLFPEEIRMYFAIVIILWVSGIGSAFLESLPYTTTMVYIIQDLMLQDVAGVNVKQLVWPLSIGACVGGIGSIMGSSANLVCMSISDRNADIPEEKVLGTDFLKHGFPTLLVLMLISTVWLIFVLVWCGLDPA